MYGDIALLHLTTPQYTTTVTLPYSNASAYLPGGIQMRVYGWGETEAGVTQSEASATNFLQTATLTYWGFDTDFPDHIFAGDYGKDTCFGDSGSPLLYGGIQYGLTSFGFNTTCATGVPGGYTDVSYYSRWIDNTLGWAQLPAARSGKYRGIGCAGLSQTGRSECRITGRLGLSVDRN